MRSSMASITRGRSRYAFVWMILGIGVLVGGRAAMAVERHVPAQYPTIQAAIDASKNGDEVLVAPGTYTGDGNRDLDFAHGLPKGQTRAITVRGTGGATECVIDCEHAGSGFSFHSGETEASVVAGFTIRNAARTFRNDGGGFNCSLSSRPLISGCVIADNAGAGVFCSASSPRLENCTITRNSYYGIQGTYGAAPTIISCTISGNYGVGVYCNSTNPVLRNCILWDNAGGSFDLAYASTPAASYSDIEGGFAGVGNINTEPRFIGLARSEQIYVDVANTGPADGSAAHPYPTLQPVLGEATRAAYSLRLADDSPCVGTGEAGANMGADNGVGGSPGPVNTTLHVAPGTYSLAGCGLFNHVSLLGAGADVTTLEGTVYWLRGGAVLRDVTVTRGTDSGVRVTDGESPLIEQCTISDNTNASNYGGGIYCGARSRPIIRSCLITDNHGFSGGGVDCGYGGYATITDCTIRGNECYGYGGGINCVRAGATIERCIIQRNSAGRGGGVYGGWPVDVAIRDCTVSENSVTDYGGGIDCTECKSVVIENCLISANSAQQYGGGLHSWKNGSAIVRNSTIFGNVANWGGAGVVCREERSLVLTHCTIVGNGTSTGGGVFCWYSGSPTIVDCILWGNSGGSISADTPPPTVSFSDVEGGFTGPGNLNADPRFVGYGAQSDIYVDAANAGPADGSPAHPYPSLQSVIGQGRTTTYSLRLADDSPCIGTATGGADMGADHGSGRVSGAAAVTLHVAGGTYSLSGCSLANHVSLIGAGQAETVLEGGVYGLRSGSRLARVRVTKASDIGVPVGTRETPVIEECAIIGSVGAGIECWNTSPTIRNCTVSFNRGGIDCSAGASPTIEGCIVTGNSGREGAGISTWSRSYPTVRNCVISGNSAGKYNSGGGVGCRGAGATLINCLITGNDAAKDGGGLYCYSDCRLRVINCTVTDNRASRGSGIALTSYYQREPNRAEVASCVLRNGGNELWTDDGSTFSVRYSDVSGGWAGEGNIDADPLFVGPANGDYRIRSGSPCIDAGSNADVPSGVATDLDGKPRFLDDPFTSDTGSGPAPIVDMGAYEFVRVLLDVRPGACPNPLNPRSRGVVPVAILGTEGVDVSAIDPTTLRLLTGGGEDGPAPFRWAVNDVSSPLVGGPCSCPAGPDGRADLVLQFRTQDVVTALDNTPAGDGPPHVTVSGNVVYPDHAESFTASDCVRLVPSGDADGDGDVDAQDFMRFQSCFNGPNRSPRKAGCDVADFDNDTDVDASDFLTFQGCFNGSNRAPNCS